MKKSAMLLTAFMFGAALVNAQTTSSPASLTSSSTPPANPNAPEAIFESEVVDYGNIEYNSDGTREFKFKNTGKEPLIVFNAVGSCGCTVPTTPKEPIKPGETGVIKVHYDTKRVGSFEKTVTVTSNAKTPNVTLRIKGVVKAAPVPAETPSVTTH